MFPNLCIHQRIASTEARATLVGIWHECGNEDKGGCAADTRDDCSPVAVSDNNRRLPATIDYFLHHARVCTQRTAMKTRHTHDRTSPLEFVDEERHVGGLMVEAMHQHHLTASHGTRQPLNTPSR